MIIDAARRKRIRARLARHMERDKVSARQIAALIKNMPEKFDSVSISEASITRFLDVEKGKVADIRVSAIEKYLDIEHLRRTDTKSQKYNVSDLFFNIREFFGMTDEKVRTICEKVVGTWNFYALSENDKTDLCRGAINFTVEEDGQFMAKELQTTVPAGTTDAIYERYEGHFLFRRDSMILLLRDEISSIPKFYVLSIPGYDSEKGRKITMSGSLLKVGALSDVFSTKVYFVRDDDAFDKCGVFPAATVPTIKKRLD